MNRLLAVVLALPLAGCLSTHEQSEPARVTGGVFIAKKYPDRPPYKLLESLKRLASAATNKPVNVELHVRNGAARCTVTTTEKFEKLSEIAMPMLHALTMYFDDVVVSINNISFELQGDCPEDGDV